MYPAVIPLLVKTDGQFVARIIVVILKASTIFVAHADKRLR